MTNEFQKNFINMYGSISHCYEIHKRRMTERNLPYVGYSAFRNRVAAGWPIYEAIHTPPVTPKAKEESEKISTWSKIKLFFRRLFK